jgi:hypothetical protein
MNTEKWFPQISVLFSRRCETVKNSKFINNTLLHIALNIASFFPCLVKVSRHYTSRKTAMDVRLYFSPICYSCFKVNTIDSTMTSVLECSISTFERKWEIHYRHLVLYDRHTKTSAGWLCQVTLKLQFGLPWNPVSPKLALLEIVHSYIQMMKCPTALAMYRNLVTQECCLVECYAVDHVRSDVSEECTASIIRVTRISELRTLAVTSNRNKLRRYTNYCGDTFLRNVSSYKSHEVSSQKKNILHSHSLERPKSHTLVLLLPLW